MLRKNGISYYAIAPVEKIVESIEIESVEVKRNISKLLLKKCFIIHEFTILTRSISPYVRSL